MGHVILLLLISLAGCGEKGGAAVDAEGGEVSGGEAACLTALEAGCGGTSSSCGGVSLTASESSWVSSVVINDGAVTVTSVDVTLSLTAHNDRKITGYYLSEDLSTPSSDASGWVAVEETADLQLSAVSYQLSAGDGEKTLNGWFKDACGDLSPSSSAAVTLAGSSSVTSTDPATPASTNPETPTVSASAPTGSLTLAGGAAVTNTLSVSVKVTGTGTLAVTHYALSETNTTPASSSPLWNTISSPSTAVTIDTAFSLSASGGEKTVYGWVKNGAGLVSAVFSDTITLQTTSLSAGLTINSGATFANARGVSLSLSGLGPVTITGYLVLESATTPPVGDESWTVISPQSVSFQLSGVSFQLSVTDGLKTVYLHLKDSAGNTAKVSATITLDATAPTGSLKLDSGAKLTVDAVVSAGVTGTDAIGVVAYTLRSDTSTPSVSDPGWTAVTSTTSLLASVNRTLTDLVGMSNQYLWLKDAAGNVSAAISDGIEVVRVYTATGSSAKGEYSSIAVDSTGKAHMSSYDSIGRVLRYTNYSGGAFANSVVDQGGADVGAGTSIAADTNGNLHVAYRDTTNSKLKYATNSSGSWVTETIEAGGISPSIGVDSGGKVHISHQAGTDIKYVNNLTGSWSSQVVITNATTTDTVGPSTLFVDANNAIHIVRNIGFGNRVRYASNQSGSWQVETIDTGTLGSGPSITVGNDGNIYAAYSLGAAIKVAKRISSGNWQVDFESAQSGMASGIAADSEGFLHLVFNDTASDDLFYATNFTGSWTTLTIDSSGDVGDSGFTFRTTTR